MSKVYRTARGDAVDMDLLRLANEETIAIGNARTNARGDELGPGGKIVKTRAQIMSEYHKLNTPVADDSPVGAAAPTANPSYDRLTTPIAEDIPVGSSNTTPNYVKPRGSLADSVAKETEVNQELLNPTVKKTTGVTRI